MLDVRVRDARGLLLLLLLSLSLNLHFLLSVGPEWDVERHFRRQLRVRPSVKNPLGNSINQNYSEVMSKYCDPCSTDELQTHVSEVVGMNCDSYHVCSINVNSRNVRGHLHTDLPFWLHASQTLIAFADPGQRATL